MSHAVDLTADGSAIVVLIDPTQGYDSLARPVTPKATMLNDRPPAWSVPLSWPAAVQMLGVLRGEVWYGPAFQAWLDGEADRRTRDEPMRYTVPDGLTPYTWQTEAAARFALVGRSWLKDDPGTGKTISALLGIAERQQLHGDALPALVLAPASTIDSWVEAAQAWTPHLRTVEYRGQGRTGVLGTADLYVTSYGTMTRDVGDSTKPGPLQRWAGQPKAPRLGTLVEDEHHMIKNPEAKRSVAARMLARRARHVIGMSGTPITHHAGDAWPMLESLEPSAWPARDRYLQRFCDVIQGDERDTILGLRKDMRPQFDLCLAGVERRVSKADALPFLPPKVYSVRTVELPTAWRKAYDTMEQTMLAELPDGEQIPVMSLLAQLGRLSQLASAAADVKVTHELDESTGEIRPHYAVTLKAPSWKVDAMLEVLDERPTQQVVVFSHSRQLIRLAEHALDKRKTPYATVVGGQTAKARTEGMRAFQAGQLPVMLVTTGAGGTGITLTAASTAVFLTRPWSLVESIQAEDRCHRIGSEVHDSIEIVDIVAADTVDSRVRAVLREKAGELSDLLADPRVAAQILGGTTRGRAA